MDAVPATEVLDAQALTFSWRGGPSLTFPPLRLLPAQTVFVHGPSGSGKSTLLGLLAGVLVPSGGELRVAGQAMRAISQARRDRVRADHLGYIFQQFNLLPFLTVAANVRLACGFSAMRRDAATRTRSLDDEIDRLLAALELDTAAVRDKPAGQLSVGQQQRVAAARALIGGPSLLIADEPTSALDAKTRTAFIDLLLGECARHATAVVFVSHDMSLAGHFERRIELAA